MAEKTGISWTRTYHEDGSYTDGSTWNCISGCSRVDDLCRFCYAETLAKRFNWGKEGYQDWSKGNVSNNVMLKPQRLKEPLKWKSPRKIFVNSLSDWAHEEVPYSFLDQMWDVMLEANQHQYLLLTKRPQQAYYYYLYRQSTVSEERVWPDHIWMGTSIGDKKGLSRLFPMEQIKCKIKFLSCEPLLEDLGPVGPSFTDAGISWVIGGGESGSHLKDPKNIKRWMKTSWALSLKDQCVQEGIPFYFKQNSGYRSGEHPYLTELTGDSYEWHQFPGEMTPPKLLVKHSLYPMVYYGPTQDQTPSITAEFPPLAPSLPKAPLVSPRQYDPLMNYHD